MTDKAMSAGIENATRYTIAPGQNNLLPVGDALFRINNYPSQGVSTVSSGLSELAISSFVQ